MLIIITVPKSGDLSNPNNYKGISHISLVTKLYNTMIMNKLRPTLDPLFRNPQNGFRRKKTTIRQIVALRRLLGFRSNNVSCVLTFIDFKKAFHAIHRGKVKEILPAYGVPEKLVAAVTATYSQTWAKVRTPDGDIVIPNFGGGASKWHTGTIHVYCSPWLCTSMRHQW